MAICCGGTVTQSLIAPHPGPLAIAETLKIDLGITIIAGIFLRLLQHGVRCLLPFVGRRPAVPQVRSIAEKLSAASATEKSVAFPAMSR